MNWANSFFKNFRKPCLQTDGGTDGQTDGQTSGWIQYNPIPSSVEWGYNDMTSSIEFHGIPWDCSCHWNWWGRDQIHGFPWNFTECRVCKFPWHGQSHGIPWNLVCTSLNYMSRSKEFHGIIYHIYNIMLVASREGGVIPYIFDLYNGKNKILGHDGIVKQSSCCSQILGYFCILCLTI